MAQRFWLKYGRSMVWSLLFTALLACMSIFQVALVLGAPLGRFTWGGQNAGVLPPRLRIAAGASILIYAVMALLALDRVEAVDVVTDTVSSVGMWVVFGFFALSTIPNAISRSAGERYVMTPLSVVAATLTLLIALT